MLIYSHNRNETSHPNFYIFISDIIVKIFTKHFFWQLYSQKNQNKQTNKQKKQSRSF